MAAPRAAATMLRTLRYASDPGSNVDRCQAASLTLPPQGQPPPLQGPHCSEPFRPRKHPEFFLFTAQQAQHGLRLPRKRGPPLKPGQGQEGPRALKTSSPAGALFQLLSLG